VCKKVRYPEVKEVPCTVNRMVCEKVEKKVPCTVTRMVREEVVKQVPYTCNRVVRGAWVDAQGNTYCSPGPCGERTFKEGATCNVTTTTCERRMVQEECVKKVRCTVWETVVEEQCRRVPVTVCEMKPQTVTCRVPYTVCETVPCTVHRRVPYQVCEEVCVKRPRMVCEQAPACQAPCAPAHGNACCEERCGCLCKLRNRFHSCGCTTTCNTSCAPACNDSCGCREGLLSRLCRNRFACDCGDSCGSSGCAPSASPAVPVAPGDAPKKLPQK